MWLPLDMELRNDESAAEVVRAAADLIGSDPEALLAQLQDAQILHAWQLIELLPEEWASLGASIGFVSSVRRVLDMSAANPMSATKGSTAYCVSADAVPNREGAGRGTGSSSSIASSWRAGAPSDEGGAPRTSLVRNLDTGELVSDHQVNHMLSQLSVTQLPDLDEPFMWPTPRSAPELPVTPRGPESNEWGGYEEAMATFGQLCRIIKRALARCKHDKRMGYEARILVELLQDLEATGVLVVADWPSKLLLNAFRDIISRFFGKPQMPWHGVLFLHRAEGCQPGKTQPGDEFVCSYIDPLSIHEAYTDRNLSAAYVAYKRFKEENPWVTHANIKTECASAEVWLVV